MAVEWTISDGFPVVPELLLTRTVETLGELTHTRFDLRLSSRPALEEAGDLVIENKFGLTVSAVNDKNIDIDLDQLNYDAGSGTCFGYVESARSKISVAVAVVFAACWQSISGGDLSGTGLNGRRLVGNQPLEFLRKLFDVECGEDQIVGVARRLGCESFV